MKCSLKYYDMVDEVIDVKHVQYFYWVIAHYWVFHRNQDQGLLKCSCKRRIFLTQESYAVVFLSSTMHQKKAKKKNNPDPSQAPTNVREIDRWPLRFRYGWKKDQRTTGGCLSLEMGLAQLLVRDSCWSLSGRSINDNEIIEKQSGWQAAAFRRFITKHCWENSPYKASFTHV